MIECISSNIHNAHCIAKSYIYVTSIALVDNDIASCYSFSMKSIEDIRRENFRWLVRRGGDITQAEMARRMKVSPAQVQQWKRGDRTPESESCRRIEVAAQMPPGWMDQDHTPLLPEGARPISLYHPDEPLADGEFEVPAVNIRVGAGSSIVTDPVEVDGMKRYRLDWAIKYALKPDRLIRYQVRGESMEPVIKDGAWILVEMGDFPIHDGMPYLIRAGEDIQVKFLFKRPDGGVIIRSHNPASPDVILTTSERGSMAVLGRIVESVQMWIKPVNGNGASGRIA